MMSSRRELWIASLGLRPYAEVLELQRELARSRITGELAQDLLVLVEHPPVVTLGRSAKERHLVVPRAALTAGGVGGHEVGRGGRLTVHGTGQLVGLVPPTLAEMGSVVARAFGDVFSLEPHEVGAGALSPAVR